MKNLTAKDLMIKDVIIVPEDMKIPGLIELFKKEIVSGAPVINKDGDLVGVVTLRDIVEKETKKTIVLPYNAKTDFYLTPWRHSVTSEELKDVHVEVCVDLTVKDIMTSFSLKITEETPIAKISEMMLDNYVHRLIVTRDGKIVGMVTTSDMLKVIKEKAS